MKFTLLAALLISTAAHADLVRDDQTKVKALKQTVHADRAARRQDQKAVRADREKLREDKKNGAPRETLAADREKLNEARLMRDKAATRVSEDKTALDQARAQRATDRQAHHEDPAQ